ncbi:MAG: GNAT family N-acetyltransferase [Oscillospiraceae bacterium]
MENYEIKFSVGLKNLKECGDLRQKVFVEEQKFVDEFDMIDDNAIHELILLDTKPVATARAFVADINTLTYKIGRVCVLKEYRNLGLGKLAVINMENYIRKIGGKTIEISSQMRAEKFYEKLGYEQFGEEYLDENCPHIAMKKEL